MQAFLQKYLTTEAVFALSGALWLVVSSFTIIPDHLPLGVPVPGFNDINITPGLLIGVAVIPVLIKTFVPGKTPFVGNTTPPNTSEGDKDA